MKLLNELVKMKPEKLCKMCPFPEDLQDLYKC